MGGTGGVFADYVRLVLGSLSCLPAGPHSDLPPVRRLHSAGTHPGLCGRHPVQVPGRATLLSRPALIIAPLRSNANGNPPRDRVHPHQRWRAAQPHSAPLHWRKPCDCSHHFIFPLAMRGTSATASRMLCSCWSIWRSTWCCWTTEATERVKENLARRDCTRTPRPPWITSWPGRTSTRPRWCYSVAH